VVIFTHQLLYPRGRTPVPIEKEAGWVPGVGVGSFEEEANLLPPLEFEPRILQPVTKSQRCSGCCNITVYIELWKVCVQHTLVVAWTQYILANGGFVLP